MNQHLLKDYIIEINCPGSTRHGDYVRVKKTDYPLSDVVEVENIATGKLHTFYLGSEQFHYRRVTIPKNTWLEITSGGDVTYAYLETLVFSEGSPVTRVDIDAQFYTRNGKYLYRDKRPIETAHFKVLKEEPFNTKNTIKTGDWVEITADWGGIVTIGRVVKATESISSDALGTFVLKGDWYSIDGFTHKDASQNVPTHGFKILDNAPNWVKEQEKEREVAKIIAECKKRFPVGCKFQTIDSEGHLKGNVHEMTEKYHDKFCLHTTNSFRIHIPNLGMYYYILADGVAKWAEVVEYKGICKGKVYHHKILKTDVLIERISEMGFHFSYEGKEEYVGVNSTECLEALPEPSKISSETERQMLIAEVYQRYPVGSAITVIDDRGRQTATIIHREKEDELEAVGGAIWIREKFGYLTVSTKEGRKWATVKEQKPVFTPLSGQALFEECKKRYPVGTTVKDTGGSIFTIEESDKYLLDSCDNSCHISLKGTGYLYSSMSKRWAEIIDLPKPEPARLTGTALLEECKRRFPEGCKVQDTRGDVYVVKHEDMRVSVGDCDVNESLGYLYSSKSKKWATVLEPVATQTPSVVPPLSTRCMEDYIIEECKRRYPPGTKVITINQSGTESETIMVEKSDIFKNYGNYHSPIVGIHNKGMFLYIHNKVIWARIAEHSEQETLLKQLQCGPMTSLPKLVQDEDGPLSRGRITSIPDLKRSLEN